MKNANLSGKPGLVHFAQAAADQALVGLSTTLLNAQSLPGEIASKPPVLLVHGDQDQVLPATYAEQSAQALPGLGLIRGFLRRHMSEG